MSKSGYSSDTAHHQDSITAFVSSKVDVAHLNDNNKLLTPEQIQLAQQWLEENHDVKVTKNKSYKVGDKEFTLPFSVMKSEQGDLYALYQGPTSGKGKRHLGKGNFGTVKLTQNLTTGEWAALKTEKIKADDNKKLTELKREQGILKEVGELLGTQILSTKAGIAKEEQTSSTELNQNIANKEENPFLKKMMTIVPLIPASDAIKQYGAFSEKLNALPKRPKIEQIEMLLFSLNAARTTMKSLSELHKKNIIHRDLHAGNILLDKNGNAKIVDFGLAVKSNSADSYSFVVGNNYIASPRALIANVMVKKDQLGNLVLDDNLPIMQMNPRCTLRLMDELPNGDINQAKHEKVYLSPDGNYVARSKDGIVHTGKIPLDISMEELKENINHENFRSAVVGITAKKGHTVGPEALAGAWRTDPQKHQYTFEDDLFAAGKSFTYFQIYHLLSNYGEASGIPEPEAEHCLAMIGNLTSVYPGQRPPAKEMEMTLAKIQDTVQKYYELNYDMLNKEKEAFLQTEAKEAEAKLAETKKTEKSIEIKATITTVTAVPKTEAEELKIQAEKLKQALVKHYNNLQETTISIENDINTNNEHVTNDSDNETNLSADNSDENNINYAANNSSENDTNYAANNSSENDTNYPATNYPATNYPATNYPATNYPATNYPATNYAATDYAANVSYENSSNYKYAASYNDDTDFTPAEIFNDKYDGDDSLKQLIELENEIKIELEEQLKTQMEQNPEIVEEFDEPVTLTINHNQPPISPQLAQITTSIREKVNLTEKLEVTIEEKMIKHKTVTEPSEFINRLNKICAENDFTNLSALLKLSQYHEDLGAVGNKSFMPKSNELETVYALLSKANFAATKSAYTDQKEHSPEVLADVKEKIAQFKDAHPLNNHAIHDDIMQNDTPLNPLTLPSYKRAVGTQKQSFSFTNFLGDNNKNIATAENNEKAKSAVTKPGS